MCGVDASLEDCGSLPANSPDGEVFRKCRLAGTHPPRIIAAHFARALQGA
jgi:hypothetical protein